MADFRILDGTTLKIIAMVCMVFDHIGDMFFPEQVWMRVIGRLAMPIFSFCIAEGYIHTRDRKAYLMRMLAFGVLSEIPFDLASSGRLNLSHQNIMFTFALALAALMAYDYLVESYEGMKGVALGILAALAAALASIFLKLDCNFAAIGLVFVFYFLRNLDPFMRYAGAAAFEAIARSVGIYRWGILSFLFIMLYNGKRGAGLKLLFYLFYPGHLLLLYLIKLLVR